MHCRIVIYRVLKDAYRCFSKKLTPADFHDGTGARLGIDEVPVERSDLSGLCREIDEDKPLVPPFGFPKEWEIREQGNEDQSGQKRKFGEGIGQGGWNQQQKFGHQGGFGGAGNAGFGPQKGNAFTLREDTCPSFVTLLAPLTSRHQCLPVSAIAQKAGTTINSLPYLNAYGNADRLCYNNILGYCRFDSTPTRCPREHPRNEELVPGFVEALCNKLKPGVEKVMKEGLQAKTRFPSYRQWRK